MKSFALSLAFITRLTATRKLLSDQQLQSLICVVTHSSSFSPYVPHLALKIKYPVTWVICFFFQFYFQYIFFALRLFAYFYLLFYRVRSSLSAVLVPCVLSLQFTLLHYAKCLYLLFPTFLGSFFVYRMQMKRIVKPL